MLIKILYCSAVLATVAAKCEVCSLFTDYYDDVAAGNYHEIPRDKSSEVLESRHHHSDRSEQDVINSLGRFSDITTSLFGNLLDIVNDKSSRISSGDVPDSIRGRGGSPIIRTKSGGDSEDHVTNHIFNIFDTIGSGFMKATRIDGPHVCSRESTKKSASDGKTHKVEKSCRRFRDARKCVDSRTDSKGTTETIRIEECCEGYDTTDIFKHGCPYEATVQSMEDVLDSFNSSLWSLAKKAKVEQKLNTDDITVILSPDNEDKPEDAKSYVLNRIVPGMRRSYDWTGGDVLKTIGGGEFVISQTEDAFGSIRSYVNCLPLNTSSHRTRNGIVYIVDGDLKPSADSLLSALTKDHRFSTFVPLLPEDLREKLESNSSYTVFAPSDKALSSLSESLLEDIKTGAGCASDFARSHVVDGSFCSHDLFDRRLKSLAGGEIDTLTQAKGGERVIRIGKARVIVSDIFAKNGVIHMIDDVVFSDELLSWREHLEVYNHNLKSALEETVGNSTHTLTIFVPPSENETISSDFAKNHVVLGEVIEDLKHPMTITTAANSTVFTGHSGKVPPIWIRISTQPRDRRRGQVGCTRIMQDSVRGCHAVLHFVEKPIPLVTEDFNSFLQRRRDLSRFYRLWRESSVNGSLTDEKPITAFIPSDDSFSNNQFKKLLATPKLAEIFVRRYIVDEPLCTFDLRHNPSEIRVQTYLNLNGEGLRPSQVDDDTFIDGARVQESENVLGNGVAYVLESTITRNYVSQQPSKSRRRPASFLSILS